MTQVTGCDSVGEMRYLLSLALAASVAAVSGWVLYVTGLLTSSEYVEATSWGLAGAGVGYLLLGVSVFISNKVRRRRHRRRLRYTAGLE